MDIKGLRDICGSFKAVTEDIKWDNDLVFSVGGKMFCVAGLEQQPTSTSFKVTDEEFEELSSRPGFKPAPYLARYKWVWLEDINLLKKTEWNFYLRQSYELVSEKLPLKIKKQIGIVN
jgi:predicted DNA-binding protein (MmcQ/YjbR family)